MIARQILQLGKAAGRLQGSRIAVVSTTGVATPPRRSLSIARRSTELGRRRGHILRRVTVAIGIREAVDSRQCNPSQRRQSRTTVVQDSTIGRLIGRAERKLGVAKHMLEDAKDRRQSLKTGFQFGNCSSMAGVVA